MLSFKPTFSLSTFTFTKLLIYLPPPALGFPGCAAVKNPPASVGDAGWIPGMGRSPGGGMTTHSGILTWEIPWTEEPGRLRSMDLENSLGFPGGASGKEPVRQCGKHKGL